MKDPDFHYYFCRTRDLSSIPTFHITPKEYFDKTGFLDDRSTSVPSSDLPPGFQRVMDSTFEYRGGLDPVTLLLMNGSFMWRDMDFEIKMRYERRRLLNIDDQE
jgi:hypothetical protein